MLLARGRRPASGNCSSRRAGRCTRMIDLEVNELGGSIGPGVQLGDEPVDRSGLECSWATSKWIDQTWSAAGRRACGSIGAGPCVRMDGEDRFFLGEELAGGGDGWWRIDSGGGRWGNRDRDSNYRQGYRCLFVAFSPGQNNSPTSYIFKRREYLLISCCHA